MQTVILTLADAARRPLAPWLLIAALLLAAHPSRAEPELQKPTEGYVYYHRAGADMAAHDAAVEDCVRRAGSLATPAVNLVGAVMVIRFNDYMYRANIENCMVARGWDVVRVGDDEGRRLGALPPADQSAALAPWVGATTIHGDVVRGFEPLPVMLRRMRYDTGQFPALPPLPLSLTAADHKLQRHQPALAAHYVQARGPETTVHPGDSVIVVRLWSHDDKQRLGLWFARLDDPQGQDSGRGYDYFEAIGHARLSLTHVGPAEETIYVVPVKPGRWRLLAAQDLIAVMGGNSVSLCAGGPAFDVAPGEAVFAGSFDAAAEDSLAPDLALAPVTATLHDAALAQRLAPARWLNRRETLCGLGGALYLYGYDMPGAPVASAP